MEKDDALAKSAWSRVERELERRNLKISWLAARLKCSLQRVQNWTTRGLPPSAFAEVAVALNESTDWLFGLAEPRYKSQQAEREKLTAAGVKAGATYDSMSGPQQEMFVRLLETTFGAPVRERPREFRAELMDIELEIAPDEQRKDGHDEGR